MTVLAAPENAGLAFASVPDELLRRGGSHRNLIGSDRTGSGLWLDGAFSTQPVSTSMENAIVQPAATSRVVGRAGAGQLSLPAYCASQHNL
jgi:hypothetical protein